ncbi:MAG TPA: hypothetical protein VLE49_11385 [Anaerolineales bacterium]|nr:hypothetical protein [Anaerolineales bacterium]
MKLFASLFLAIALAILPAGGAVFTQTANASALTYSGHPTIFIVSVDRDDSVTIKARNLPPDYEFRVRMGRMGTRGIGGTIVDTFDTGDGGTQTFTFDIPSRFHGDRQIAIRIEATSGTRYFAFNWFFNNTSGTSNGGTHHGYSGFPRMRIMSVTRNTSVRVRFINLPPDDEFKLMMNRFGTRGRNGTVVSSFETGDGGNQTMTFDIPSDLRGLARIAIRIESKTGSGFFAFNWFFNR